MVEAAAGERSSPWRIAMLTPLPPARTGVAHYASMVLPALQSAYDPIGRVEAFSSLEGYDRRGFDAVIYQLGNNPHHEPMYREAMREPGLVVLHDLVLHHLIVEMTLARGDAGAYVRALEANHGAAGAAWARGRAAGVHTEMGNFLLPASVEVAQRARAVIVHNRYAADRLRSFGVTTPIHVVPHPYLPETRPFDRGSMFAPGQRVIGFFGFLTSAKRAEVVLQAFRVAREKDPRLELLIVGEPAPNVDVDALRSDGVTLTGYVADDDFPRYYAIADRFVNLRYPSAGETSGTLIRALDAGKPVAVSDYAQFAEFPDDVVFKVPLGAGEVERLIEFFTSELPDPGPKQRAWLQENAAIDKTVEGYLAALAQTPSGYDAEARSMPRLESRIALFPRLELLSADATVRLTVRNAGETTIRTRTYGSPEYRLIARLFRQGELVLDRWLSLPCDLHPGQTAEIAFENTAKPADTLRLYHALQDVPMLAPEPWETVLVR